MSRAGKLQSSSVDYFKKAKELHHGFEARPDPTGFLTDDDEICDGVSRKILNELINPANWSEAVKQAGKKPRVYLETLVNQAGNLEVRWAGGLKRIVYASDFDPSFTMGTQRWNMSTTRSPGEVMYVQGFQRLLEGPPRYSELYSILLAAYSTCLALARRSASLLRVIQHLACRLFDMS